MHPRLAELLEYLDTKRSSMLAAATAVPAGDWGTRPAPDRWSVAEVCWHLHRVETGVARLVRMRADESRAQGHPAEDETSSVLGRLDGRGVQDRSRPIEAPPQVAPKENPTADRAVQLLAESRGLLRAAIADADGVALGRMTHPHPALGELDLYQWILLIGQHEERHTGQIVETAAAVRAR